MGMIGGYTLDLYCEHRIKGVCELRNWDNSPLQFFGETKSECIRQAKKNGWVINKKKQGKASGNGYTVCPNCKFFKRTEKPKNQSNNK